jgi:C-terminal processing protease CtpA/Prc
MKKIIVFLIIAFFFVECSSVKKHNAHINDLISEKDLKEDTDFIYRKLQKLHPRLYWYTSKKDLDYKFDSLKATISKPMTSYAFYKKITPVICAVRQGHVFVFPYSKILSKKESAALKKKGDGPFSQFEFEAYNHKLYVAKNKSYDKSIAVGSEIVSVNGEKTADLFADFSKLFMSDGFNTTFKDNKLGTAFPTFYTYQNGVKDSIKYDFIFNNELKSVTIKRQIVDSTEIKNKKIKLSREQKKSVELKKDVFGYDAASKKYMRNLSFKEKDSSIAVMKINGFRLGDYKKFYKESFKRINEYKTKTLIIDLRNNGGGRLFEISNLYSYLADSEFQFVDKSEAVSRTSLLGGDFYTTGPVAFKIFKYLFTPIYFPIIYFSGHKNKEGYYTYSIGSKKQKVSKTPFKGKVYVLINGGSFSASSIISSNLKGSKRAYFVGEETGGAFNGTVAGQMPSVKLPHSKIKVKMGLLSCIPHHKADVEGRGIFPDMEIKPTLEDRIKGTDPEMEWIVNDIKKTGLQ